jgi:argininosuccinate lyase
MSSKLWGGRFREPLDEVLDRFNASLGFDKRLYAQDIEGSMAHCRMLSARGILTEEEASRIVEALAGIRREMDRGEHLSEPGGEDIHSLVESLLVERIGALGEKIHTGRSRNDQVALDVRMYVKEELGRLDHDLRAMQAALVDLAESNAEVICPGYTHMQRAQPVLLAHHLMAYYEMLKRDRERARDCLFRVDVMPLGSAALAGSGFDLDRDMVAGALGFSGISRNSMDAVSDRDFVAEFLFLCSLVMMHLSRLSEEIIIWSTQEFGFVRLPDAFCTGSSIMPQKKNPDLLELVRGKTGRVYGHLMGVLTTLKGLPMTYNKDMQEDKEPLFDSADTVRACLEVMTRLLQNLSFDEVAMGRAAGRGYLTATDLADYLVKKGLTFRKAHETAGAMVLTAMDRGVELSELPLDDMRSFSERIEEDVYDWLDPARCVARRNLAGGTGPEMVALEIKKAREEIEL